MIEESLAHDRESRRPGDGHVLDQRHLDAAAPLHPVDTSVAVNVVMPRAKMLRRSAHDLIGAHVHDRGTKQECSDRKTNTVIPKPRISEPPVHIVPNAADRAPMSMKPSMPRLMTQLAGDYPAQRGQQRGVASPTLAASSSWLKTSPMAFLLCEYCWRAASTARKEHGQCDEHLPMAAGTPSTRCMRVTPARTPRRRRRR